MSENEKLIACCGLYCGDCFAYQGRIADLARDLRKELRDSRFDKVAAGLSKIPFFKEYKDYGRAYAVLGAMVRFRCRRACSGGGGPPSCKMRNCSRKKGHEGCWDCGEFEDCARQKEFARTFHGDATLRKLRTNSTGNFRIYRKASSHLLSI